MSLSPSFGLHQRCVLLFVLSVASCLVCARTETRVVCFSDQSVPSALSPFLRVQLSCTMSRLFFPSFSSPVHHVGRYELYRHVPARWNVLCSARVGVPMSTGEAGMRSR